MRRRVLLLAALVSAVALGLGVTVALSSSGPTRSSGHATSHRVLPQPFLASSSLYPANLPADCVLPAEPRPGHEAGGLIVVGVISLPPVPSTDVSYLHAPTFSVPRITAKLCGTVSLVVPKPPAPPGCPVVGQVTIPVDGQKYGPLDGTVTVVPGMTPQVPVTPVKHVIIGTFVCPPNGKATMGLTVSSLATFGGAAGLFGLGCAVNVTFPFNATVMGPIDQPWGLTGSYKTSGFPIPAAQPSASCPPGVASNLNEILGLRIPPKVSTLSLSFAFSIFTPPQA